MRALSEELHPVMDTIRAAFSGCKRAKIETVIGFGSTIFAVKPGDGSAREQAASCQKVLGGWANIANEYATKRYRSNLINWGMLPFVIPRGRASVPESGLSVYCRTSARHVEEKQSEITAYVVKGG